MVKISNLIPYCFIRYTFIAFKKVILSCLTYETDYKISPDIVKEVQVEVSGRWEGESHMT